MQCNCVVVSGHIAVRGVVTAAPLPLSVPKSSLVKAQRYQNAEVR